MFADLVFSKLTLFEQGLAREQKDRRDKRAKGQQHWRGQSCEEQGCWWSCDVRHWGWGMLNSAEGAPEQVLGDQGRRGFTPCVGSH